LPTVGENDAGTVTSSVPAKVADPVATIWPNSPLAGVPALVTFSVAGAV